MASSSEQLEILIKTLGQSLFMPGDSDTKARRLIDDKVFSKLKTPNSRYSINRTLIMGSAEKHTGVWPKMDYDCVIFVNINPVPNSSKKVKKVQKMILKDWKNVLGDMCKLHDWGIVVSLDGMDLDLLVAFAITPVSSQQDGIMKIVKSKTSVQERVDLSCAFSTSLAETMVNYLKNEESVTHEVIRVVKLWLKFSGLGIHAQGLNTLLEIVCVHAMKNAKNGNSVLEVFKNFLHLLTDHKSWDIEQENSSLLSTEERKVVMKEPFVINPENPYENMCRGQNVGAALICLESRAEKTLRKIENWKNVANRNDGNTWLPLFQTLYVDGSSKRHKIRKTVGKSILYVSNATQKVYFVELKKTPSKKNKKLYDNVMRFICYSAAFIPRERTTFEVYFQCLVQALNYTSKLNLSNSSPVKGSNFEMLYPLPWGNGEGVSISGCLKPRLT